jgi:beta-glucanase (GH16 family)
MIQFDYEGHAPSFLPDGKKWKLVWNDEFDGDKLDESKWSFRRHLLQLKHHALVGEEALEIKDGCAYLKLVEKDGEFFTCQLQTGENYMDRPGTDFYEVNGAENPPEFNWPIAKFSQQKFVHRYGYYECRCKVQKNPGWWSAFWMQSPIIGCCPDPRVAGVEVDIMECFYPDKKTWSANNHWGGYGPDHQHEGTGELPLPDSEDGFHTFGLLWTPEKYVYYMDGKEVGQLSKAVSQVEQFLLISTEAMGYRVSFHHDPILKKEYAGDAFIVDYVRVFDEVE